MGNESRGQIIVGSSARDQRTHNMKLIALAMHEFAASTDPNRYPPAAIRHDGQPLLSWRVVILPFLGYKDLYDQFHLDEPWDNAHNAALLNQMPEVYAPVIRANEPVGATHYQVFTGPGTPFEDELGPKLMDITDGTFNTILFVEAGRAVPWTKPEDIPFDNDKPVPRLGRWFDLGFHVVFCDGSIHFLSNRANPEIFRPLITGNDGMVINCDDLLRAGFRKSWNYRGLKRLKHRDDTGRPWA
jgi:hypothetical protein